MIIRALQLIRSLSRYHYRTILLTILLPVIGPPVIAYYGPDCLLLQVILYVAAFLVWSLFAVLVVASMVRRERSEAERSVAQQIAALSVQISRLKEQHDDSSVDLRREVDNLEEVVRTTLSEKLGVLLPPRPISIRARINAGSPTMSATLTVVGGSKVARLRQWLRRTARRLWEVVYGNPEGG